LSEAELIKECLNNNPRAQELLYKKFAPQMYGICLRYARDTLEAEDILQDGFIKVFESLNKKNLESGSLEGWIRKIIVRTAINNYHQYKNENHVELTSAHTLSVSNGDTGDVLRLMQSLPDGYRTIFNLYAVEGYDHKEIAQMFNISEGTSKSQLHRARLKLQKYLEY
jgi:RNA polymerase sigma-70 factor (ECF subfamily)